MGSPALLSVDAKEIAIPGHRYHWFLLASLFILTLPLINPLVHGDGVGYYAYLRAPLIQHNFHFEDDWRLANSGFAQARLGPDNQPDADQYTSTGHIGNLFTTGPAILWTPFFLAAHGAVLVANAMGAHIPADGFSLPYRVLVAFGTAVYGFFGLLLSYLLTRKYVDPSCALLATLAIWGGSSLPVYMYFNPFWSHAHSVFVAALFLWFWDGTRPNRTVGQWLVLGLLSGLLVDVYFVNGVFLLIPLVESIHGYVGDLRSRAFAPALRRLAENALYLAAFAVAILPTLITRKIIFGGILRFGAYTVLPWDWRVPYWRSVLFSSDHGLLTWTPLLGLALLGLLLPFAGWNRISGYLALAAAAFFCVISCYPYWDGLASYGNRFFISLTPVFILGLGRLFEETGRLFRSFRYTQAAQGLVVALFVLWNLAFIFQWGTHMVPVRGEISWGAMAHNQVVYVPQRMTHSLEGYFLHRSELMQQIEQEDIEQQEMEGRRKE